MTALLPLAQGRFAHPSGALWVEAARTVLVADVHLGYGWAQRRRGELGPVADVVSQPKLQSLVDELQPTRVVLLGDIVHAPRPAAPERALIEETLEALARRAELILVRGNHDRGFVRDFGHLGLPIVEQFEVVDPATGEEIVALHGDRLPDSVTSHLVVGHLHPAIRIRDAAGASRRLPLFLTSGRVTLLPAFSPFAAGVDISRGLPPALKPLFSDGRIEGIVVTGRHAARIRIPSSL